MAESIKILGQASADDINDVLVYAVPALKSAVLSTIAICNTTDADTTFTLYVVKAGDSTGDDNAIYYEAPLQDSDTFTATLGITLGPGDGIYVSSDDGVIVHVFGTEIS